jgi:hypothetical protein
VEIDKRVKKFPMGAEAINKLNLRQLVKAATDLAACLEVVTGLT